MFRYKFVVAYDGTKYSGWQIQPNAITIQQQLEKSLEIALRQPTQVIGSARTDAGVHALAQVAHFNTNKEIEPQKLHLSLNGLLPKDIRILSLEKTTTSFHARYSAKKKVYRYFLNLQSVRDPFNFLYSLQTRGTISIDLIKKAANYFVGTHDFTSFSNEAHKGSASRNPVRTLYRLDAIENENGLCLEFEGNGFLYKMVRNITGTLLAVGRGKLQPEQILELFAAKDRRRAAAAAPAHALFLVKVDYTDPFVQERESAPLFYSEDPAIEDGSYDKSKLVQPSFA